jgi:hypothetical protein
VEEGTPLTYTFCLDPTPREVCKAGPGRGALDVVTFPTPEEHGASDLWGRVIGLQRQDRRDTPHQAGGKSHQVGVYPVPQGPVGALWSCAGFSCTFWLWLEPHALT